MVKRPFRRENIGVKDIRREGLHLEVKLLKEGEMNLVWKRRDRKRQSEKKPRWGKLGWEKGVRKTPKG